MRAVHHHVRYSPKSGHRLSALGCPLCAKSGHSAALAVDLDHCVERHRFVPLHQPAEAKMQGRFAPLLRTVLAALLMLATMFSAALGGPFEDAVGAYEKGDYGTALQGFRALADDGREDAQYFLGHMYLSGKGVLQNYTEAANWFRLAAEQGRADDQYALGYMYLNGQGVKQDYVLALMWIELSVAQGNELAAKARDDVARHLNPTQISEAQRLARDWKQTPHREIVDMQQFPWSSIGKLAVGGQHCTGAVIGPNEFLALHTVFTWNGHVASYRRNQ
jgi:hypothetical protein